MASRFGLQLVDHIPVDGHTRDSIWVTQIRVCEFEEKKTKTKMNAKNQSWGVKNRDICEEVGKGMDMIKTHCKKLSNK